MATSLKIVGKNLHSVKSYDINMNYFTLSQLKILSRGLIEFGQFIYFIPQYIHYIHPQMKV